MITDAEIVALLLEYLKSLPDNRNLVKQRFAMDVFGCRGDEVLQRAKDGT